MDDDFSFDDVDKTRGGTELPPKEKAKAFLAQRSQVYRMVFKKEDQAAKQVLEDLARFCRAEESTFHSDSRCHAVLEGRREVWLRIQNHITKDPEELLRLYVKG